MEKRRNCSKGAISPLFHNIFNKKTCLTSRDQLHLHLLNAVVDLFFPQVCKSDMSKYGYLEIFLRVPCVRDNESRLYVYSLALCRMYFLLGFIARNLNGLVCLFVLRFYGPVNPMGSCQAWSVSCRAWSV